MPARIRQLCTASGSALVTAATAPLARGLAGDIYVVIGNVIDPAAGLGAAAFALLVLAGLWYGYPLVVALHRREAATGRAQAKASGQRS
jgi:hypothetical protein